MRNHPIPPVTEPLQYRAIGIVRGFYKPEDKDQFNRGKLIDLQGEEIDSVVLGRVITLMRRHISIEKPHLWVVYPRCREAGHLHLQISGIWEPSTLDKTDIKSQNNENQSILNRRDVFDELPEGDDYFSIRGDLIFTRPENNEAIVKIRQKNKNNGRKSVPFKIILEGNIPIDGLRNFVSLNIRRNGQSLVVEDYQLLGPSISKIRKSGVRKNPVQKKKGKL
ncbi:hypothetical protein [Prochlorococcus sp. MIT 1223]|uniref:hypothetical protein n=1 Tax=Prochlorococcus sp. MIT 1223 TaxID=3096217 RepID=UPI002A764E69|nr:hypothetical protein [Prochlorococcus sp. MIT 1223]